MAAPRKLTDAQIAEANDRITTGGQSIRSVAKSLGVSDTALRGMIRTRPPAPTPAPGAFRERMQALQSEGPAPGDPENDDPDDPGSDDPLASLKSLYDELRRSGRKAEKAGNHSAAQRYKRDAAGLVPAMVRLRKIEQESGDTLHISRREIDAAYAQALDNFAALIARAKDCGGLVCAKCHREIVIDLVERKDGKDG